MQRQPSTSLHHAARMSPKRDCSPEMVGKEASMVGKPRLLQLTTTVSLNIVTVLMIYLHANGPALSGTGWCILKNISA